MKGHKGITASLLSWTLAALLLSGPASAVDISAESVETGEPAEAAETVEAVKTTEAAEAFEAVEPAVPVESAAPAGDGVESDGEDPDRENLNGENGENPDGENLDEETAELQGLFGWKSRPHLTVSLDGWAVGQTPNQPAVTGNEENAPVIYIYRDTEGNVVADITAAPAGDYTVTAFLEESEDYTAASARADFSITPAYTVIWRNADGTILETDAYQAPGTVPQYDGAEPVKERTAAYTYAFSGWAPAVTADSGLTADVTYTAVYAETLNRYAVDFLDDDGTVLKHAVYDYGTKAADIVRPSTPKKGMTAEYAFTFSRWTPEIADVTGDAAYTAAYDKTPVQIYYPAQTTKSYYSVLVEASEGGTVRVLPSDARPGTPVLLSVTPDAGYVLDALAARGLGHAAALGLSRAGDNFTFSMPGFDVSVTASFLKVQSDETENGDQTADDREAAEQNADDKEAQNTDNTEAQNTDDANATPRNMDSGTEGTLEVVQYSLIRTGFSDVSGTMYYARAVRWAAQEGILSGVTENTFAPDSPCTRAQMVLALWRASGSPRPARGNGNPFSDVDVNSPYYEAVLWAMERGVTRGTTASTFSPERPVTRAQAVTLLYRLRGSSGERANPFADAARGQYFYEAALWACEQGITRGTTPSTFSPAAPCTRAQAASFLYRAFAG